MILLLLLFTLDPLSSAAAPLLDCFVDQEQCEINAENLIQTFLEVPTFKACSALCEDELSCVGFTHFSESGFPFPHGCLLFSSCKRRVACQGCSTGSTQAECTCSLPYQGLVTPDNFVDLIGSVMDEHDCKNICIASSLCSIYTYYDSEDTSLSNVCVLLTSSALQEEVQPCRNCHTGSTQCNTNSTCQISVVADSSGSQVQFPIFAEENLELTLVAGETDCFLELNVVAVGGGGGDGGMDTYPGAGSGHIETMIVRYSSMQPVADITVGKYGEASSVVIGGEMVVEAASGENGDNTNGGGEGFSGGGGGGGGNGGEGGSDGLAGEDGVVAGTAGGRGSSFDLETVAMEHFNLTAGEGGEGDGGAGGGGGGVIVNGKKPGVNQLNGQGFGGGGRLGSMGYQGCVLIENKINN